MCGQCADKQTDRPFFQRCNRLSTEKEQNWTALVIKMLTVALLASRKPNGLLKSAPEREK